MAIVPKRVDDLLLWAQNHAETWAAAAPHVGLSEEQCQRMQDVAAQAAADHAAGIATMEAARAALVRGRQSVADLRETAAEMLRSIKAFAESSAPGAPSPASVYAAAQIPPPAAPSPAGPPGQPYELRATLNPGGSLTLRFKCRNPVGTCGAVYTIRRRTVSAAGAQGEWEQIAAVGDKAFTDHSIPAGAAAVEYTVQGQRGALTGPIASLSVPFGSGSVPAALPARLAA